MDGQSTTRNMGSTLISAWKVWRGSIRSQNAEAWERAFLAEGSSGSGYVPPQHASRVVFLGDSLTHAWEPAKLFPSVDVLDAGVDGDLLSQMRERWRKDVLAADAGIVHLMGGTNNIVRGYSQGFIQRDMLRMVKLAEISRMRMVLGLLPPMRGLRGRLNDRVREFNLWLRIFGEERRIPVADYYSPLADANGELHVQYAALDEDGTPDTVHLNRAAYEMLTPVARQAIERAQQS